MSTRITLSMNAKGVLELWLNGEGRDWLVRELQSLNEGDDRLLLHSSMRADVQLRTRAYKPLDTVIDHAVVRFRTDERDQKQYPHVMNAF